MDIEGEKRGHLPDNCPRSRGSASWAVEKFPSAICPDRKPLFKAANLLGPNPLIRISCDVTALLSFVPAKKKCLGEVRNIPLNRLMASFVSVFSL
mmetsp:Transcript_35255/g.140106  ORF Transcript_35255/g.140106 Transcript_35255/m.140106 type:complete len:95 (+) Transcript_35255:69-353(+)